METSALFMVFMSNERKLDCLEYAQHFFTSDEIQLCTK